MTDIPLLHYRLESYVLTNAPKQAGFVLCIPTSTLGLLSKLRVSEEQAQHLQKMCNTRLHNLWEAKMIRKSLLKSAHVRLWENSPVPRFFTADPIFGGSLGADPETFGRLCSPETMAWLGDEVAYTPHNVDNAVGAIVLTVLVATWAEWAQGQLYLMPRATRSGETAAAVL